MHPEGFTGFASRTTLLFLPIAGLASLFAGLVVVRLLVRRLRGITHELATPLSSIRAGGARWLLEHPLHLVVARLETVSAVHIHDVALAGARVPWAR